MPKCDEMTSQQHDYAEAWAIRAVMAVDVDDEMALEATLSEFDECEHCVAGVIIALATALIGALDSTDATSRDGILFVFIGNLVLVEKHVKRLLVSLLQGHRTRRRSSRLLRFSPTRPRADTRAQTPMPTTYQGIGRYKWRSARQGGQGA
jgi:hypothetical protein